MKKIRANILLVEDDENLSFIIKDYLEMLEYKVNLQKDGILGYEAFITNEFDLCILDVMLPGKDGFSLAEDIKALDEEVPIIFLTARSMPEDRIKGLKMGADDYITKPFSIEELSLRIEAVLKRVTTLSTTETVTNFTIGTYSFDYTNQILQFKETEKHLTKTEAEVLFLLCQNKNKLVRRDFALKKIWGENDYFKGRSMDVYIAKLRKYLSADKAITITNIHGTGFKLEDSQQE